MPAAVRLGLPDRGTFALAGAISILRARRSTLTALSFATIIALHGCSGLGHGGQIQPRYLDWAERFLKAGDAVLFPDSYGSRGVGQQCQPKQRKIFARRERVAVFVGQALKELNLRE